MLAVEIAIEYESEEFNQQANFQKSATERIDRKSHILNMVAQKDSVDKVPLPALDFVGLDMQVFDSVYFT